MYLTVYLYLIRMKVNVWRWNFSVQQDFIKVFEGVLATFVRQCILTGVDLTPITHPIGFVRLKLRKKTFLLYIRMARRQGLGCFELCGLISKPLSNLGGILISTLYVSKKTSCQRHHNTNN